MGEFSLNTMVENFHFIYPDWLWLLLPTFLLLIWLGRTEPKQTPLHKLIDPKLAPFVLTGQAKTQRWGLLGIITFLAFLAVIAMAGPSWKKVKQASFKKEHAVVIALDLSASMYAKDIQPSRLMRARFELIDLLKQRKEGQTGLVVYAGAAFTVSPLTNDADSIEAQVKLLSPDIMPVQGSRTMLAIEKSIELLEQAGAKDGQILLVTDEIVDIDGAIQAAQTARNNGVQTSILAIGTEEGSPIPSTNGGFIKDAAGSIVLAKTNHSTMQRLTQAGDGIFVESVIGDQDLTRLSDQFSSNSQSELVKNKDKEVDTWINEGVWLLFILLPFGLLAFRKGYLVSTLLIIVLLPQSDPTMALSWDDLWLTPDQQGQKSLNKNDYKGATEKFTDPNWKASAAYKAGDYQQALDGFSQNKTVDGIYNQGNALVKLNKLEEAKKAYEEVLTQDKDNEDAKHNLDYVNKMLGEEKDKNASDQSQQSQNQQNQQNQNSDNSQSQPSDDSDGKKNQDTGDSQDPSKKEAEAAEQEALKESEKPQDESSEKEGESSESSKEAADSGSEQREQQQALEQWLRRIPDDPAGLWRRKFKYQYRQDSQQGSTGQTW